MSGYEELVGSAEETVAPVETPAAEAAPEPQVQEPAPSAEPASVAATPTPAPVAQTDPMAPVKALLEERDRRQAAEREAAQLRAWRAEQERKAKEAHAQAPNMLEDPEGYHSWIMEQRRLDREALKSDFERQRLDDRLQTSRELIEDQLQDRPEEFKQLCAYIDTWPQTMHAQAQKQAHPYRWALKKMREAEKAKRSEKVLSELGDKDLNAYIEEQVAARLAAQAPQTPDHAAELEPDRPRNADGTFASSQTQQRRTAPSLASVNGSTTPRSAEPASGYDALFKRG